MTRKTLYSMVLVLAGALGVAILGGCEPQPPKDNSNVQEPAPPPPPATGG